MTARLWIVIGALMAATAVGIGAFGAHSLPDFLERQTLDASTLARRIGDFETGARYHFYHALALVLVGLVAGSRAARGWNVAGWLFVGGIVLFSGSLYALVLTGRTWLGAIVPIGGLAFIVGWLVLAMATFGSRERVG